MPKAVVEALEMVNIDHNYCQRRLSAQRSENLPAERFLHVSSIEQAGERISNGLIAQTLAQLQICQGQADVFGHCYCQPEPRLLRFPLQTVWQTSGAFRDRVQFFALKVHEPQGLALCHDRDTKVGPRKTIVQVQTPYI